MAYNTRKKSINFKLLNSSQDDIYSESGSEYIESDSSDTSSQSNSSTEDFDCDATVSKLLSKSFKTLNIKKPDTPKQDKCYVVKSDDYFSHTSLKKSSVSRNTIEAPELKPDELRKLLSKRDVMIKHKNSLVQLDKLNENQFCRWLYLMEEGFNILLYGLGSKMEVLQSFHKEYLGDVPVIVVNGFFPSLSFKSIIEAISSDVLEISECPLNVYETCDLIRDKMLHLRDFHLYIIVHNIEGDMLKNSKSQNVLSKLASIKNIHFIVSIDHISAPLIWDNSKLSKFNFLWFDVTSFLPYINETSFEGSMVALHSTNLALSALNNVFLSLTSNSKQIYLIIAKYQLENGNHQHYQGYLFKDLYWACREAFLVSTDLVLRSQLTEFVDHKMLRCKRSADGSEYLIIPTATNILQQFHDEQSK